MRWVIPGSTLTALGFQTICPASLSAFWDAPAMSDLSPPSAATAVSETAAFDAYAREYDAALAQGFCLGRRQTYFAQGRVSWLAGFLSRLGEPAPITVLDFGCGTGSATPYLLEGLGAGRSSAWTCRITRSR
jgi:SAM-dependent methyltransferase